MIEIKYFILLFVVFLTALNIKQIAYLSHKYIIQSNDDNIPYLISSYVVATFINILLMVFIFDGSIDSTISFYVYLLYSITIVQSTTRRFEPLNKNVLFNKGVFRIISSLYFTVFVIIFLIKCLNRNHFHLRLIDTTLIDYLSLFSTALLSNNVLSISLICMILFLLFSLIFNLIYDLKYKSLRSCITVNILNFYPLLFIIAYLIIPYQIYTTNYFFLISCILYFIIPNVELYREYGNIELRLSGVDSSILDIRNTLDSLKEKELNNRQKYQLEIIKEMMKNNSSLKNRVFKTFTKKQITRLNSFLDN